MDAVQIWTYVVALFFIWICYWKEEDDPKSVIINLIIVSIVLGPMFGRVWGLW